MICAKFFFKKSIQVVIYILYTKYIDLKKLYGKSESKNTFLKFFWHKYCPLTRAVESKKFDNESMAISY